MVLDATGFVGLALLVVLSVIVAKFHMINLDRIYKKVSGPMEGNPHKDDNNKAKKDFYEALSLPQGSNFTIATASTWILFSVAVIFYFFLTPTIFENFNYFIIFPVLASSQYGFLILGFISAVIGWVSLVGLKLPQAYSYYDITKNEKLMVLVPWVLLLISLIISANFGTAYPQLPIRDLKIIDFAAILVSEGILLSPFILEFLEVKR
jgi:hypothetical protein